MKTHLLVFVLGSFATLLVARYVERPAVSFTPAVQAQTIPTRGRSCDAGAVVGTYALSLTGETLTGNNEGPYAGLGVLTLDTVGAATLVISQNYNGVVVPTLTTAGRYAVGNDCAGIILLNTGARFEWVASASVRELDLLQTVQGSVVHGVAKKQ